MYFRFCEWRHVFTQWRQCRQAFSMIKNNTLFRAVRQVAAPGKSCSLQWRQRRRVIWPPGGGQGYISDPQLSARGAHFLTWNEPNIQDFDQILCTVGGGRPVSHLPSQPMLSDPFRRSPPLAVSNCRLGYDGVVCNVAYSTKFYGRAPVNSTHLTGPTPIPS